MSVALAAGDELADASGGRARPDHLGAGRRLAREALPFERAHDQLGGARDLRTQGPIADDGTEELARRLVLAPGVPHLAQGVDKIGERRGRAARPGPSVGAP